jgi:hypothetical protein
MVDQKIIIKDHQLLQPHHYRQVRLQVQVQMMRSTITITMVHHEETKGAKNENVKAAMKALTWAHSRKQAAVNVVIQNQGHLLLILTTEIIMVEIATSRRQIVTVTSPPPAVRIRSRPMVAVVMTMMIEESKASVGIQNLVVVVMVQRVQMVVTPIMTQPPNSIPNISIIMIMIITGAI